jgi:hypothetical protein
METATRAGRSEITDTTRANGDEASARERRAARRDKATETNKTTRQEKDTGRGYYGDSGNDVWTAKKR